MICCLIRTSPSAGKEELSFLSSCIDRLIIYFREEFRVCLVSRCEVGDVFDFYFGGFDQFVADAKREANPNLKKVPLPHVSNFNLIYITPVPDEENKQADEK